MILYYTIRYYTILYYSILYYTILYYVILYYTIIYYTILQTKIKAKKNDKWKIPHTVLVRGVLWFSSSKNHKLKIKLWWIGARERKKRAFRAHFVCFVQILRKFVLMYSILKTLSEYTYFYISKDILSYTFFLVFEIVKVL